MKNCNYTLAATLSRNWGGSYNSKFGKIIGYVVDKNNVATCYFEGEERKYKTAVTKIKKNNA